MVWVLEMWGFKWDLGMEFGDDDDLVILGAIGWGS